MSEIKQLHLFEGYGVELEYMIVERESLNVIPLADEVIKAVAGEIVSELPLGRIGWSNELVLHVIELKTNGPAAQLRGLAGLFQNNVSRINRILEKYNAQLLPTAMHPWMDPYRETRLWPHESNEIYQAYDRIFGCQGHGWSNLQSTHLNLPFSGDQEFGRLHAAVRLALPILPALAASSPFMNGIYAGYLDQRLEVYRLNQQKIPAIAGRVIPEPVFSRMDYEKGILQQTYQAIAPHDPLNILKEEWLNSRGAIARFGRGTIEIRILDIQECPAADLAILTAIVALLKALTDEKWTAFGEQRAMAVDPLADIFLNTIREGENTPIADEAYLSLFGFPGRQCQARELWYYLAGQLLPENTTERKRLDLIIREGTLASRILRSTGTAPSRENLVAVYRQLGDCLASGQMFLP